MKTTIRERLELLLNQYKFEKGQCQDRMHEESLKGNWSEAERFDNKAKAYGWFIDDLRELIQEDIIYGKGVDLTQGFVEALVFERILTKKGSYFRYQDTNIAQGMKNLRLVLDNSPELLENLKADLDELKRRNYGDSCTEVCDCEFERIDSKRIQCIKCEMIQSRDS